MGPYFTERGPKYNSILGEHNNWVMLYFVDNGIDNEEYESVYKLYYDLEPLGTLLSLHIHKKKKNTYSGH